MDNWFKLQDKQLGPEAEPQDPYANLQPLVAQYMRNKYSKADAQKDADNAEMIGIGAGALDKLANSNLQPVVLQNRMQDLGKAPSMIEQAQQHTDVSGLQKQAQMKLQQANSDEDNAVKMAFEQRKQELANEAAAKRLAAEQEHWNAQLGLQRDTLNSNNEDKAEQRKIDREKIEAMLNKPKSINTDITLKLSDKYNADPVTKATAEVRSQAARAEKLASTPNAVNDMGLVYSLMKSFDPGSTVREGEFAMAAKAGGFGDRIKSMVELAETGQMTAEKRAEVLSTIKAQAVAQEERQAQADKYYSDIAGKYEADPELIIGSKRSTAGTPAGGKTPVKKQYSPSRKQTRIIYSDGTVEIKDGEQ